MKKILKMTLKENKVNEYVGIGNVVLGYRDMILPPPSPRKEDFIIFD